MPDKFIPPPPIYRRDTDGFDRFWFRWQETDGVNKIPIKHHACSDAITSEKEARLVLKQFLDHLRNKYIFAWKELSNYTL